jgi:hypothetical protein
MTYLDEAAPVTARQREVERRSAYLLETLLGIERSGEAGPMEDFEEAVHGLEDILASHPTPDGEGVPNMEAAAHAVAAHIVTEEGADPEFSRRVAEDVLAAAFDGTERFPASHFAHRFKDPEPNALLSHPTPDGEEKGCERVEGGYSCTGTEERYVRDEISRAINALIVACGNLLSVREHSPAGLDSEFTEFKAEFDHAASFFALLFDWGRDAPDKWRSIELVEGMDAWGASKDQEGIEWLTCHGRPVLNLRLAFQRAALPSHDGPASPVLGDEEKERLGRIADYLLRAGNKGFVDVQEDARFLRKMAEQKTPPPRLAEAGLRLWLRSDRATKIAYDAFYAQGAVPSEESMRAVLAAVADAEVGR